MEGRVVVSPTSSSHAMCRRCSPTIASSASVKGGATDFLGILGCRGLGSSTESSDEEEEDESSLDESSESTSKGTSGNLTNCCKTIGLVKAKKLPFQMPFVFAKPFQRKLRLDQRFLSSAGQRSDWAPTLVRSEKSEQSEP